MHAAAGPLPERRRLAKDCHPNRHGDSLTRARSVWFVHCCRSHTTTIANNPNNAEASLVPWGRRAQGASPFLRAAFVANVVVLASFLSVGLQALHRAHGPSRCAFEIDRLLRRLAEVLPQAR